MRRVACFYRVSTTQQLDGDDIPMQRNACQEFMRKNNWTMVKEYVEKGVSGFKVSAINRDEIQRAKKDAEKGEFDILLCFMFDRLGRRDDETPFVLEWFSKKGIELWSVKEGQQKFSDHTDKLINYIRFWQSSGESQKTSMRVTEKFKQMTKEGQFRGGIPPYGYKTVPSGVLNKKGKNLLKLVIDDYESSIVKDIFDRSLNENMGNSAIAKILNDRGCRTRTNGLWHHTSINGILKNPVYKGVMKYTTKEESIFSDIIPELQIISEDMWKQTQQYRKSRIKRKADNVVEMLPYTGRDSCLTIGVAYCGHCGHKMIASTSVNKQTLSDGTRIHRKKSHVYRCVTKLNSNKECDGQSTYSANKIDPKIERFVFEYLDTLGEREGLKDYSEKASADINLLRKQLSKEKNSLAKLLNEKSVLQKEIPNALMGNSKFSVDLLSELVDKKDEEVQVVRNRISQLENDINEKQSSLDNQLDMQESIPTWVESYQKANTELKKKMIFTVVQKITLYRDNIEIDCEINPRKFAELSNLH